MESNRYGYAQLRDEFLGLAYEYCRVKAMGTRGWIEGETSAGFARDQLDGVFDSDIENLMLEVVCLISAAGREPPKIRELQLSRAAQLLDRVGGNGIHQLLDADGASELLCDLKILGLWRPKSS